MKSKIIFVLYLLSIQVFSQTVLGVDTIYKSGPLDKRINVVIISEGFLASEMPNFSSKASSLTNYLFNQAPFKQYKKYFNVFAIRITSPQSGVSHPGTATDVVEPQIPVQTIINNFATTFDNNHTHRAIVSPNSTAVYSVLAANFPMYDEAVILANSPEYGGTGGAYAVMSINSSAPETLVHELGHSFAGLADEYWAGTVFATEKPNMTSNNDPNTIKWEQWLGTSSIGIYPYGTAAPESNWFRPHQNCKMQFLNVPFCAVCRQTIIEEIHSRTNPIDAYEPAGNAAIEIEWQQWFKTTLVKPAPNTLRTGWELNQTEIAYNKDSLLVTGNMLLDGNNSLVFTAIDTTLMSRDADHPNSHFYSVMWDIEYTLAVGIQEIKRKLELNLFPNPASNEVNLEYTLAVASDIGISIADINGKVLINEKSKRSEPGNYKTTVDVSSLAAGNYILTLKINNQTINNKIIISK